MIAGNKVRFLNSSDSSLGDYIVDTVVDTVVVGNFGVGANVDYVVVVVVVVDNGENYDVVVVVVVVETVGVFVGMVVVCEKLLTLQASLLGMRVFPH